MIAVGMLYTQSLGSLFGIIFHKSDKTSLMMAIGTYSFLSLLCNFFIPVKDFNDVIETLSEFSYCKYELNSVLIAIYGFDRCPQNQTSIVLHNFDINDDDIYWKYARYLIYNFTAIKLLGLIALIVVVNEFSVRMFFKKKPKKHSSIELSTISSRKLNQNSFISRFQYFNESFIHDSSDNLTISQDTSSEEREDKQLIISWIDLTLNAGNKFFSENKIILNSISGGFEFGSLNALMGSSGAGKTTLLRCLNGRYKSCLSLETQIYLSSREKIRSCFICQDINEHLLNGLKVKEILKYASILKNSRSGIKVDHKNNIKSLMSELMINDIANTSIENCSGGQKKLIVIASELTSIIKPNLLCMDEPTSGLDSDSAEVVSHIISKKIIN
jgi:ABC-type Mn2+/Zn2+ transport system ATPase subunit